MRLKLIIGFLISMVLFSKLVNQPVLADSTIPLPIPGINCGLANDPDVNNQKCCYYDPTPSNISPPGFLQTIWDVVKGWVNDQLDQITQLRRNISMDPCVNGAVPTTPGDLGNPSCNCIEATSSGLLSLTKFCSALKSTSEQGECNNCLQGVGGSVGIWTSIGCVRSNLKDFITQTLLGWGVGLAGIIALLCIIYSAFQMQISQGNPEKIKKAQELLTSCIMGLMLIIFSVFILRLIGVNILRIPGFQ